MHYAWNHTGVRFAEMLPDRYKIPLGAFLVVAVLLIGGFASPESQDNTRDVLRPTKIYTSNPLISTESCCIIIWISCHHWRYVGNFAESEGKTPEQYIQKVTDHHRFEGRELAHSHSWHVRSICNSTVCATI